ncbi:ZIP family metal transporter [Selenomonas sp. TAMA-11512]|uniref:ZIP family metal transporter n=1 Tax=Selenomonas sp. TAMA-11512 TaxID=3095337 RepID=UPI003089C53B|nr:ZIP family metal transporter [Selenomonas sp. TAMA-11512]
MFSSPVVWQGLLIPFLGTTLGAACSFFLRGNLPRGVEKALTGFAAGVMVAASVWSLLIPAMEESAAAGDLAFVPAVAGFWLGTLFLLLLDRIIPHLHQHAKESEGPKSSLSKSAMLVLAVTLHNIPEGMAVGVVLVGFLSGEPTITVGAVLALSIGIAIQNFPEGAIISMPLRANGMSRGRSFLAGTASGIVEPIGGAVTILLASLVVPVLPYLLSFAAGAMMYVVVEELIPEMSEGKHSDIGVLSFALGFTLMMALDTALGYVIVE